MNWKDGSSYVGEWKNGKWHGQGEYPCSDGLFYVGYWKDGKRHRQGGYMNSDCSNYMGNRRMGGIMATRKRLRR